MNKTLDQIRCAFIESITAYLADVCRLDGEALAVRVSDYLDWNWPAVETSYMKRDVVGTGCASDFTCYFICEMLRDRV